MLPKKHLHFRSYLTSIISSKNLTSLLVDIKQADIWIEFKTSANLFNYLYKVLHPPVSLDGPSTSMMFA